MALMVYDLALQMLGRIKPLIDQVKRKDRPLADQLQRAAQSSFLNIAEGRSARGLNEAAHVNKALDEAREARAAVQLSVVWGYIPEEESQRTDADLDRMAGMLWGLIHRPRRS